MKEVNKPRILFVAPLPPPVHGSAVVSQQIRDSVLINDEFDCDFVNMSTSRSMSEIGQSSPLVLFKKLARFFESYFCSLLYLIRHRYSLCYLAIVCNGIGFLKDAPFVLLCKMFGCRIVIHLHNKGVNGFVDRPIYKTLIKWVYKDSKVILLSEHLYLDISKAVDRKNVYICPNGIPELKTQDKEIGNVPEILFLSNLIESKGVYVLLDACKILKEKGFSFHCTFVGGESKQIDGKIFKQALSERNIQGFVEYVGPKYGEEKEAYWNKTSIFVFPTFYYNECFPLVLLEAMQHKVAVVSTNEGGIPDIVSDGETGYIVDSSILKKTSCNEMLGNNIVLSEREKSRGFNRKRGEQTAAAIEELLVDKEKCSRLGIAGYEKYKQKFTEEIFISKMVECLRSCI